jgi:hypothetical protein
MFQPRTDSDSPHHPSAGSERLVLQPWHDDHLALGDVGHAFAHHVVDLEPEERRGLGHVDACTSVKLGVHEARTQRVHADAGAAETVGQPFGERDHPGLGCRVR